MRYLRVGFIILSAAIVFSGCLERNFAESGGVLSVHTRELVVPADRYEGRNLVRDTLFVTSNRSWSSAFDAEVDWVKMDTIGHQNMAGISQRTPLAFSFLDNESESERSAVVKINCSDGEKTVTIRQVPISYRLSLQSSTEGFNSISPDGAKLKVAVNSNTEWTISVKDGINPIDLKLSKTGGKYSDEVDVDVVENMEYVQKDATIIISSPKIQEEKWPEIPLVQMKGYPYFRFTDTYEDEEDRIFAAMDGVSSATLGIKTNSDWRAVLVSTENVNGVYKEGTNTFAFAGDVVASGDKSATTATIQFPATLEFGKTARIKVKFLADNVAESYPVTITQKPCVRFSVGKLDPNVMWKSGTTLGTNANTWTLKYPPYSGTGSLPNSQSEAVNKSKEVTFETKNGIQFRVFAVNGLWKNSKSGLMIGAGKDNTWIEIPSIPGFRLTKILYTYRGAVVSTFAVQTFDGSETLLGECSVSVQGCQYVFEVPGTQAGASYRMVDVSGNNFQIGDMVYYYE